MQMAQLCSKGKVVRMYVKHSEDVYENIETERC